MTPETIDRVISMAWADRITFEEIEKRMALTETEVIQLMRTHLKPASFRRWRKRVSGRKTKHRKLFQAARRPPSFDED